MLPANVKNVKNTFLSVNINICICNIAEYKVKVRVYFHSYLTTRTIDGTRMVCEILKEITWLLVLYIGAHQGGIGSRFPVKISAISRNPMNSSQYSRSRLFLLVIPLSTFFQMRALSKIVTIEQLSRKIIPRYNRAYKEGVGCQFPRKNSTSSTTSNLARNFGPEITRSFYIFPVY